ncbi:hypothetical protein KRX51_03980 [Corynebacterium sp. TAE3-ERU12]|uniref:hypothetical protein n=1 Tax=Corynebacterium sp. TAE3-ERU12 TaxID=2849491 RepID=UPI001C44E4B0|nr:hypothetical protein [Corynebacterium sp. TAE3-ERU12]MBV7295077.1 hypothetical protein [Corynebacterium sp. TAE3-ERU12]
MSNTVDLPSPTNNTAPAITTTAELAALYRTTIGDDLRLTGTFLRHPTAARGSRGAMTHEIELPDASGIFARMKTRRVRLPRVLVRQLAKRDPDYFIFDGEPIYLCELTITIRRRAIDLAAGPGAAQWRARAIAEAMHPARAAINIHDCGARPETGDYRFSWISTRSGHVLTSPAELFDNPGKAA